MFESGFDFGFTTQVGELRVRSLWWMGFGVRVRVVAEPQLGVIVDHVERRA